MTLVYMDLTLKRNASNFDFTEILSKCVLHVEKHFFGSHGYQSISGLRKENAHFQVLCISA